MLKRTHVSFTAKAARHAEKIIVLSVVAVLCGFFRVVTAAPPPPAKSMYADAMAREQKSRAALNSPDATPVVLADVRAAVTAYESIVQHYPGSGYSDDALWQAGQLSLDAFARFGQQPDKDRGLRLLRKLSRDYPTSKLARQVPDMLTKANPPPERIAEDAVRLPGRESGAAPSATTAAPPTPAAATAPVAAARKSPGPAETTPSPRSSLATIKAIRRVVLTDAVRIMIDLDGEVPFHEERIQDPERVFVDLPGTRAVTTLVDQTIRFEGDGDIVRQVRVGRHPNNTTRVVLDAAGVTSYSVYPLYSPYRLVIDCVRVPAASK